ncbi:ANTAR domain-containing response regulator [Polycyclovorans algicola]|uniref:ANTAR domain-containing response regulator n=1 Tax=Polycyclovorans algicola TaxID=616992 RepID=UPI0004A71C6C|nr:ANTAR domain-containing protein [Polycyclovorans algicola]
MRVMLVDDHPERLALLEDALTAAGHVVAGHVSTRDPLVAAVQLHKPDIVLIDVDAPSRDTLESLVQVKRDQPCPVVMFAAHSDNDTIRRAIHAGVSAYVVDGLATNRIQSVMDVAIARFAEFRALQQELDDTRLKLADRRDVDKAKGLLMQRRGLDEAAAYALLRRMAMSRNLRLGDAARALISAAELL